MSGICLLFRRACLLCFLLACLIAQAPVMADSTRVYRCESDTGRVEFSQMPCSSGDQQILDVEDVKVGWDAPVPKVETGSRKPKYKAKVRKKRQVSAQACFKKRQRLESVNRKLRRGYKAGQGVELRHRRRQYEEYLSRFCDS